MPYYLSNLDAAHLPTGLAVEEYLRGLHNNGSEEITPFASLFLGYGLSVLGEPLADKHSTKDHTFPINKLTLVDMLSDVVSVTLRGIEPLLIKNLTYCHEMLNAPEEITPSMQVKKNTGLKQTLPFSLRDQGAAISITAIQLLELLHGDNDEDTCDLVVCGDFVASPQIRLFHYAFPRGDAAASFLIGKQQGPFEITHTRIETWSFESDSMYDMSAEDLKILESQWVERIYAQWTEWSLMNADNRFPCFSIIQHASKSFIQTMKQLFSESIMFERSYYNTANLGSSDPFYSLYELWKSNRLQVGDRIVLVFVGTLGSAGIIELTYRGS